MLGSSILLNCSSSLSDDFCCMKLKSCHS